MATISSIGIGSGLDVNSIVTQLVALEKAPLKTLEAKATNVQSQITAFAQIQTQFAALSDAATRISAAGAWSARSASSSNTSAATVTVSATAGATSFSLDVDALAQQQSIASGQIVTGAAVGAGTLTLRLGSWSGNGGTFSPASGSADVSIRISATDKVVDIAVKINAAGAGVVATVFNDGTGERLLLQGKDTGAAAGFRLQVADLDGSSTDALGLSRLAFDPAAGAHGMAAPGNPVQYGEDARARINGLAVTSPSNTLADNLPGVSITLLATTTTGYGTIGETKAPVSMSISEDVTLAVRNVQDFVTAYNTLNQNLSALTKYDSATKAGALFQGDSAVVGLQNVLRKMLGSLTSGGIYSRLSDVGLQQQLDGSLTIDTPKLSAAANNGSALQQLFTMDNGNARNNGFALKFRDLADGVLASGGSVVNKVSALKATLERNAEAQDRVSERAAQVEVRLRQRYSALDAQMAGLTALNAYVAQQVTVWNQSYSSR
jgi:flagellar hook-associated protein 2